MEAFNAGTLAGAGSFRCDSCGFAVALHERDPVPECPECGGESFRRASLFGDSTRPPMHHEVEGAPDWLAEAREALVREGDYLAFEDDDRVRVFPLQDGWTRIGRSLSAHVRFDDPTVSRRHALLYRDEAGRPHPGRPQPERRVQERRARRAGGAGGRRRDLDRPLQPLLRQPGGLARISRRPSSRVVTGR